MRELDSMPRSEWLKLNPGKLPDKDPPKQNWDYCTAHKTFHFFGCPFCREIVLDGESKPIRRVTNGITRPDIARYLL